MENDIIYFSDFPNLQETGTRKDNGKFDLTLLPTQELKEEFRGYIMYRCKNGTFRALIQDRTAYNHIAKFLNSRINRRIKSLGDRNPEKWISLLKGWMLEQGITIVKEKKSVYGTVSYGEAVTILYFRNVLKFLGPEDLRDEIEKDVWELKNVQTCRQILFHLINWHDHRDQGDFFCIHPALLFKISNPRRFSSVYSTR